MAYQYELPLVFEPPDEESRWTDDDIERLRIYVFRKTLASLTDGRVCLKVRTESLEWLMDNSIHPFSYLVCCEAMDENPIKLREMVVEILKRNK